MIVGVHINSCENGAELLKRNGVAKASVEAYLRLFNYHRSISKLDISQELIEAIRV